MSCLLQALTLWKKIGCHIRCFLAARVIKKASNNCAERSLPAPKTHEKNASQDTRQRVFIVLFLGRGDRTKEHENAQVGRNTRDH